MPEGDTIRQVASYLNDRLAGRFAARIDLADAPELDLAGRRVERVHAHGKHLFVELQGDVDVRSHLGMYGSWHRYPVGSPWRRPARQASIVIEADGEVYVCFNAKEVEVLRRESLHAGDVLRRLGPDLLQAHDTDEIVARARELCEADDPLVDVLLDQRVAAGIGNVYKSEVLFLERLHPLTALASVDDERLRAAYGRAAALLGRNLHGGPRVTREGGGPSTLHAAGDGGPDLWVYRREGHPCLRCDRRISMRRLGRGNRSTYWCPACQTQRG